MNQILTSTSFHYNTPSTPQEGDVVFDKTTNETKIFINNQWKTVASSYSIQNSKISKEDLEKWYDEEYCLEAVQQNGINLQFVKNQTEEICLEAVKQDPKAIAYVDIRKFPTVWNYYVLEVS